MAEMTESQRLWESWYQVFNDLRAAWPKVIDMPCPRCGRGRARIAYVANDPEGRTGTAFVWCDECRQGIWLGRVGIPDGADVVPFDASDDEVEAVIPGDIDFLPPDPAPPSV
jgi:hypothetical protein